MGKIKRDPQIESGKIRKSYQDTIFNEIHSQMPLQEKVSLANMKKEDVEVLQGVFDYYIRNRVDPEDEDYENIMHELWERVRETHRLRVVK
jgi:uncharacterized protein (DUF39 family)